MVVRARPHWIVVNSRVPRLLGGHGAITVLFWTFVAGPYCSPTLRAHEHRHVQQLWMTMLVAAVLSLFVGWWALLALFPVPYLIEYGVRIIVELVRGNTRTTLSAAYHDISWERDAYRWAPKHAADFQAVGTPP